MNGILRRLLAVRAGKTRSGIPSVSRKKINVLFPYNKSFIDQACSVKMANYYMGVSHKDWQLPNSRIWLAEIDIDRGLDFPI